MADEIKLNCLVIGAGDRGAMFARIAANLNAKVVAVADQLNKRRDLMADKHDIPNDLMFEEGEDALNSGLPFDVVYIATPDKTHAKLARLALNNDYNVLLEKPMATTPKDCISLIKAQEKTGKSLAVCHVLRHAPFFQTIKKIIDSGELGDVLSIDLTEDVGYWHFAHSYVRGNWKKEKESSPVILSKSCHDLDILCWLADSTPISVFSKGSLRIFRKENAPQTSTERCTDDCPVKDCLFDARKFYLNHGVSANWPFSTISPEDLTEKGRLKAITEGPYGKCVFKCKNDVLDTQDVLIDFENGIKANFALRSGGEEPTRKILIQLERGEISGNLRRGKLNKITYSGRRDEDIVEELDTQQLGSHGGGDPILIKNFLDNIRSQNYDTALTSAQQSLQGHLLAFAAEKSRKMGKFGRVLNYKRYLKDLGI
ncbi:MAG: gfo/Idh/MocA family oxidoreductase [Thermodesulfobacteriota bacterium]|nr:MAG: gfo/Idh/MocA family oxidoreductase [Thermodesulfobacteriota bacterium]